MLIARICAGTSILVLPVAQSWARHGDLLSVTVAWNDAARYWWARWGSKK